MGEMNEQICASSQTWECEEKQQPVVHSNEKSSTVLDPGEEKITVLVELPPSEPQRFLLGFVGQTGILIEDEKRRFMIDALYNDSYRESFCMLGKIYLFDIYITKNEYSTLKSFLNNTPLRFDDNYKNLGFYSLSSSYGVEGTIIARLSLEKFTNIFSGELSSIQSPSDFVNLLNSKAKHTAGNRKGESVTATKIISELELKNNNVNPICKQRQIDVNISIAPGNNRFLYLPRYSSAEIERYANEQICIADSRGIGYCGPRYIVERQRQRANFGYQWQVGENIRGGPFGAVGYILEGERGSYVGAAFDGLTSAAAGTAGARSDMRSVSLSTLPKPVSAEVRPAGPVPPVKPAPSVRPVPPAKPATPTGSDTPRDTGPYSPQRMRQHLEERYGRENVTSTTVPPSTHPSVARAAVDIGGGRSVGFDERKLRDFSPFAVTSARVPRGSYKGEMKAATRQLKAALARGEYVGVSFTPEQLSAIRDELRTIPGYRWHHVSGGELQLVPADIHAIAHIGSGAMRHGR
jgi:hypothetical protein